jgi:hypothetical protein
MYGRWEHNEKVDGQTEPECCGGRAGEQECPDRVGAIGTRANIPP